MRKRLVISTAYKRDVKRLKRQGKALQLLGDVVEMLINNESIPAHYKNHALKGNWTGRHELHIESDWLLIYQTTNDTIYLERSGSHADLFRS